MPSDTIINPSLLKVGGVYQVNVAKNNVVHIFGSTRIGDKAFFLCQSFVKAIGEITNPNGVVLYDDEGFLVRAAPRYSPEGKEFIRERSVYLTAPWVEPQKIKVGICYNPETKELYSVELDKYQPPPNVKVVRTFEHIMEE